jgi:serine-type D-Ala-D-Ala carboxypeptidase (penicillin-binding protein 5/6)
MSIKFIKASLFIGAILIGLGVGYTTVKVSNFTYSKVSAYISDFKIPSTFNFSFLHKKNIEGLGGPYSDMIQSEFNEQKIDQYTKNFEILNSTKKPTLSSLSYLVADLETGKVLLSQNINQELPIASITKLMTALVAEETLGLDAKTIVTQDAIDTYGTQGDLKKGEQYTVQELLYPLLLESSNDAAEALAYSKNREDFLNSMNEKAKTIGLINTSFEDASGLSAQNTSTVTDLFRLTQYIAKYRSYIFDITTMNSKKLANKTWINNSRFRSERDYLGGKNGYIDEARKTHVVLFEEDFNKSKRKIVYIILRSDDVSYDIGLLRDFVQKNVEYK